MTKEELLLIEEARKRYPSGCKVNGLNFGYSGIIDWKDEFSFDYQYIVFSTQGLHISLSGEMKGKRTLVYRFSDRYWVIPEIFRTVNKQEFKTKLNLYYENIYKID